MAKLTQCAVCGAQIASNAKACPNCGAKKKRPLYKKWWFWILLVLVALPVLGSLGGKNAGEAATPGKPAAEKSVSEKGADALSVSSGSSVGTTIEKQVIFDAEGITITAMEYTEDSLWGDGIKLLIENNSAEDVGVGCDALIVNDFMVNNLFSETVAAGKKANATMDLYSSELKQAGIDLVGKVEIQFHLFNADTYMTTYTADPVIIETSRYAQMDTSVSVEGTEVFNRDGIRILAKSVDENSFWGSAVLLYLENNSQKNITVQCDDVSVNGFMLTPLFSCDVWRGKKAIDSIDFFSNELEENGIERIDAVELKLRIINADNWASIYESDVIRLQP